MRIKRRKLFEGRCPRILLVDPNCPAFEACGLNTGLGWLSASVRSAGMEVAVLDLVNRFRDDPEGALIRAVEEFDPDVVGFYVHSTTLASARNLAAKARAFEPAQVFVAGGPQVAYEKEKILAGDEIFDFAFLGEAEETFPEFVRKLSQARPYEDVPGLIFRKNGTVMKNERRKISAGFSHLPHPDYRLFGLKECRLPYPVMTSRGCPFRCTFCNTYMSGAHWRPREHRHTVEELKFAKHHFGIREFMIQEPLMNARAEHVTGFCEALIREGINLPWFTVSGLRARGVTREMLELMKRAGCREVKFGVESLVPEVFSSVKKAETVGDVERACRLAKETGLRVRGSFIVGLPGDTARRAMENFRRSQELGFGRTDWSLLVPYPETELFDWARRNAKVLYDYTAADQCASNLVNPPVKVALETPEFSARERAETFVRISVRNHDYVFFRDRKGAAKILALLVQVLRYDPLRLLTHLKVLARKAMNRPVRETGLVFEERSLTSQ